MWMIARTSAVAHFSSRDRRSAEELGSPLQLHPTRTVAADVLLEAEPWCCSSDNVWPTTIMLRPWRLPGPPGPAALCQSSRACSLSWLTHSRGFGSPPQASEVCPTTGRPCLSSPLYPSGGIPVPSSSHSSPSGACQFLPMHSPVPCGDIQPRSSSHSSVPPASDCQPGACQFPSAAYRCPAGSIRIHLIPASSCAAESRSPPG
mmetsp:Transcript_8754/g.24690  ORF Transcript_8754/g.24690 Transcript_8754/m.24690 type:complete len:204 (-) Transcript_8754:1416-2027(-)